MSDLLQSGHHPDADQLSAFVGHTLPPHELEQTLAHLAVCPDCREIVTLSLPPVDESLPQPVHKRFFRWNLAWPVVVAVAALLLIAYVRNTATRSSAGAPTQVAVSNRPAPLLAPATPEVSNSNALPLPNNQPPAGGRYTAVPSGAAGMANPAKAKASINTRSAGGPLLQNGLPQPAPASGTQAINGKLRPSVSNAAAFGFATPLPQKEPAFPADHFQQTPPNPRGATAAGAFDRLTEAPHVAGTLQAPNPAPPIATPNPVAAVNQTVEVTSDASVVTLSSTTSDIQLSQITKTLTHPLPSNLPVLSMVSNAHQALAIDTRNTLFVSDDDGNHWKSVPAPWQGRAVKVDLASSIPSKKISAGTIASEGHPDANFRDINGRVTPKTPATGSTLAGTVTDPTGAAIPDASVVVGNATTSNLRTVKTDRTGRYLVDGLVPGSYQVAAEAPGFNKQQLDVTLTASRQGLANLTLPVGQATETVAVNAPSEPVATLSVARKNTAERPSASQLLPVFEVTTDTGEHWTSPDGHTWKQK